MLSANKGMALPRTGDPSECWYLPASGVGGAATQVEVLFVDLTDTALHAPDELATEERARAARQATAVLTNRYVAGRVALRRLLAERLGLRCATDLVFVTVPSGKPRLQPQSTGPDLRFSLARSGDVALIALASGTDVGVDIERSNSLFADPGFRAQVLTPKERRPIEGLESALRGEAAAQCWVRKEAVLKSLGIGLSLPLQAFDVYAGMHSSAGSTLVPGDNGQRRVAWHDIRVADFGNAAVACCYSED